MKLRVPGWLRADAARVRVNGRTVEGTPQPGSYAEVKRAWREGDVVELRLDFAPALWEANPLVEETLNQVAPRAWGAGELYREAGHGPPREISLKFVPYFAWGNRGDTEMSVWLPAR